MNNPSPLIPQGSMLEQKMKSHKRMKTTVSVVLAVHIVPVLFVLLMQGCKREQPVTTSDVPTNETPMVSETNMPMGMETNMAAPMTNTPIVTEPTPPPVPTTTEYIVVKGDTLATIGKKFSVGWKAIQDANPGVEPTKLRIGQKLNIPAASAPHADSTGSGAAVTSGGGETYTVKSGDTLTKIASHFGVSVKSIRAENNLKTDKIKVGDKLEIPMKTEAPAPGSMPEPAPAPVTTAPAPGH